MYIGNTNSAVNSEPYIISLTNKDMEEEVKTPEVESEVTGTEPVADVTGEVTGTE